MLPNLRHLNTFREVARLGSISAAARAVHISQPAVTQAVAGLARYFGSPLLSRTSTGMTPTPAGKLVVVRVERALAQLQDADVNRMVSSGQLDALCAVVEHGSFSAAARARKLAQPSLHRSTRELERLLGIPLFEKTSFGITPTREAQKLARRARLAFGEVDQALAEVRALNGEESGRTVIAALALARSYLLPSALLDFTREHPQHGVAIVEGTYE